MARLIVHSARFRTAWFPDTNVAILDEAAPVWDALRLASLGSPFGSAFFTGIIRAELREWLEQPYRNPNRAGAIRAALAEQTWARGFGLEGDSPVLPAVLGYTRLLGLRRYLALPTPDGRTTLGTDPGDKSATMNAIGRVVGRRGQGLARKGRQDAEENREVNLHDELHCLTAVCHSLLTGRESVVLTADADFLEVFWKTQWFLHTHYRAYLAAALVRSGGFGPPTRRLEETDGYFDGPVALYRRHTRDLREVLPAILHPVPVSVVYVAPAGTVYKLGFPFWREILGMLEVRSRTGGRCTDLIGRENIHVDLGPL